jgi:hypothetical protein
MPEAPVVIDSVAPTAGIPIVHELRDSITLLGAPAPDWRGAVKGGAPVTIRHERGDVSVDGLRAVLEVEPWSTFYTQADGGVTVRFHSHDPGVPVQTLRTERPGHDYVVHYEFVPMTATVRRDKEMSAFTIALAARGRGILAHGCGFVLPAVRTALCLGVSGAGKSTLARMMSGREGVHVLNDDRIALTEEPAGLHGWSTPWPGSEGIANDGDAPLGVIALIGRSPTPAVREVRPSEALRRLLTTLALPLWSAEQMDRGLALMERLIVEVPVVELLYPLGDETAGWIERTLGAIAA